MDSPRDDARAFSGEPSIASAESVGQPRILALVLAITPLQSSFVLSRRRPFGRRLYLPGFRSSSRDHHAWAAARLPFRPRVFAPHDVLPIARSAGWFAPAPRPGFSPFRGFSLHAATLRRPQQLPPCRSGIRALPPRDIDDSTGGPIGFEAFIHVQKRSIFLPLPSSDFVLLQVLRLSAMEESLLRSWPSSAAPPAVTRAVDLQRIDRGEPGSSVSGLPTCSRFVDLPRTIP